MAHEPQEHRFARILREHGPALARLAAAYQAEPSDRDDLMQEIMLALWRALPGFRGECSERTFVYRVAHNRALTHRHRAAQARMLSLDDVAEVTDPRADPAADAEAAQRREDLIAAVGKLAPGYRQVVMLRLEGLGNGEIAEVLGATENAVTIRLTRARRALAELMKGRETR